MKRKTADELATQLLTLDSDDKLMFCWHLLAPDPNLLVSRSYIRSELSDILVGVDLPGVPDES